MLQTVYAQEEAPSTYTQSVFLAGPTPRSPDVPSWRPAFIEHLKKYGYDGVVFSPELRSGERHQGYEFQVEWEKQHLEMADVIAFWVPRKSPEMPAFTTNVEFGKYISSGKLLYARPNEAEKVRYLDWMYTDHGYGIPHNTDYNLAMAVGCVINTIGGPAERTGGERFVPLHVWHTPQFQQWYASLKAAGNRLDWAKVLWSTPVGRRTPFAYSLHVKVWIEAEQRHKTNEFVLARPDISCVLPYWRMKDGDLLDTKVVLIKEFRSPVRNSEGVVVELPGGSSLKNNADVLKVASEELKEETGLDIPPERFFQVQSRQLASTWSSHSATLFSVELTDDEIAEAERISESQATFGVKEDTEMTRVDVRTLRDLTLTDAVDWSMLGMVVNGLTRQLN